jgi:hypothetical protein
MFPGQSGLHRTLKKNQRTESVRGIAQFVECVPSKHKNWMLKPSTAKSNNHEFYLNLDKWTSFKMNVLELFLTRT